MAFVSPEPRRWVLGVALQGFTLPNPGVLDSYPVDPDKWPDLLVRFSTISETLQSSGPGSVYNDRPSGPTTGDGYRYVNMLGPKFAGNLSTEICSEFDGKTSIGTFEFSIMLGDECPDTVTLPSGTTRTVAYYLRRFLLAANPPPIMEFKGGGSFNPDSFDAHELNYDGLSGAAMEVSLWQYLQAPEVGEPLYAGEETLMLGYLATHSNADPDVSHRIGVIRGAGDTPITYHNNDSNLRTDGKLYAMNPNPEGRQVTLFLYDRDTGVEHELPFRGIIDVVEEAEDGLSVKITAVGSMCTGIDRILGQRRLVFSAPVTGSSIKADSGSLFTSTGSVRVPPGQTTDSVDGAEIAFAYGRAIIPVFCRPTAFGERRYRAAHISDPVMATKADFERERDSSPQHTFREVLTANTKHTFFHTGDNGSGGSSTQRALHPFRVTEALLTTKNGDGGNGTLDKLPGHRGWGAGLDKDNFFGVGVESLRTSSPKTPWAFIDLKLSNLILGDRNETILQAIERILAPMLCFLTWSSRGQLMIGTIIDRGKRASKFSITEADVVGGSIQSERNPLGAVLDVVLDMNRRGASNEYNGEVRATSIDPESAWPLEHGARELRFDCGDYGDPGQTGTWDNTPSLRALGGLAYIARFIRRAQIPAYSFRLKNSTDTMGFMRPGVQFDAEFKGLHNENGELGVKGRMVILASGYVPELDCWDIRAWDIQKATLAENLVAPSALVVGTPSGGTIGVKENEFHENVNDSSFFKKNMECTIYTESGAVRAAGVTDIEVASVTSNSITFTTTISGYGVSTGDVIRFSKWGQRDTTTQDEYAFMSSRFGLLDGTDPPHKWGL